MFSILTAVSVNATFQITQKLDGTRAPEASLSHFIVSARREFTLVFEN